MKLHAWYSRSLIHVLVLTMIIPLAPLASAENRSVEEEVLDQGLVLPHSFRRGEEVDELRGPKDGNGGSRRGGALSADTVMNQVHVVGAVANPSTYSVQPYDRLQTVLEMAEGGAKPRGSIRRVTIRRAGEKSRQYDLLRFRLHGDLKHNPYLRDNDVVFVPDRGNVVRVVGAVHRQAEYELNGEKQLRDVLKLAGGLTRGANRDAPIRIIRYDRSKKTVITAEQSQTGLRRAVQSGDVIFVPNVVTTNTDFDFNIVSIPGEDTFYPAGEDRVFVLGAVPNPGPYPYYPYSSLSHYITRAGGLTKMSKTKRTVLIRGDGSKERIDIESNSHRVNPGDTIYVPERRFTPEGWLQFALGITAAALGITNTILVLRNR